MMLQDLRRHAAKSGEVMTPANEEPVTISLDTKIFDVQVRQQTDPGSVRFNPHRDKTCLHPPP
jgi:hypothetical protein